VWSASGALAIVLAVVQALGWGLALASTFMIDHLALFGLRQGLGLASPPQSQSLKTPLAYRLVRHPLYLGMIVGLWSAPVLSAGHLLLAAAMTAYILVGIHHEERDLVRQFGDAYAAYRARVRKLVPVPRREVGP
jgi:protein-S-isoprenylcysteine O-methyltransferase Ste14